MSSSLKGKLTESIVDSQKLAQAYSILDTVSKRPAKRQPTKIALVALSTNKTRKSREQLNDGEWQSLDDSLDD